MFIIIIVTAECSFQNAILLNIVVVLCCYCCFLFLRKNDMGTHLTHPGPKVIKLFSYSTQLSMKFSLLIIVGIFIFISREIFMLSYV